MKKLNAAAVLLLSMLLTACGSSGEGSFFSDSEAQSQVLSSTASSVSAQTPVSYVSSDTSQVGDTTDKRKEISEMFDHVVDIGTYTELNYEYTEKTLFELFDKWGGMCSAAVVRADNGDTLVGRNFDLIISDKPVYVYKTKLKDRYETLCITYNNRYGASFSSVTENGIAFGTYDVIPFLASDVMNSEGLYIEMNMRYEEPDEDGGSKKFGCSGTNPSAEKRVCAIALPQLVGQNCADVREAVEYIRSLNVYSMNGSGVNWNLSFILADAAGNYGVLEMARNEISWLEGQPAQTNFYLSDRFAEAQMFKMGVGRYDYIMSKLPDIKNSAALFNLMNDVRYSLIYYPEQAQYDVRSEYVGETIGGFKAITYEQIVDKANSEIVTAYIKASQEELAGLTRQQMQSKGVFWESTLTLVANCTDRTIKARFFENDDMTTVLSF